jgi:ABC-2 type transport system ATP-binding protein
MTAKYLQEGIMAIIELKQLTKYYGKHRGIENVTFSVEEGEIFGFIGPNGAGKSTTIRTLLGLIYPTGGSATIFGKDCIQYGAEIRAQVGYLPSEVFYYENMRVIDVLKYSASFYKQVKPGRIKELAAVMDLDLSKKIEDLSYGNKKKVGIVQGLLHEPKLIILDEPTSGLDPLMQEKFFDLIAAENKKGATVLFSSHILPEVQKLCTRVAIIKEGSIVKVEDMTTLRNENYKKLMVETIEPITDGLLDLEGVTHIEREGHQVRFLFRGDINLLLSRLQDLTLRNLLVEEPTLEEIFMHYYRKGEST